MAILTIAGRALPTPSGCVLSVSDVKTGSARAADGTAVRGRAALKRSLDFKWNRLSAAEYALVAQAAHDGDTVTVALTGIGSLDCFLTAESADVLSANGGTLVWSDVRLSFEEV